MNVVFTRSVRLSSGNIERSRTSHSRITQIWKFHMRNWEIGRVGWIADIVAVSRLSYDLLNWSKILILASCQSYDLNCSPIHRCRQPLREERLVSPRLSLSYRQKETILISRKYWYPEESILLQDRFPHRCWVGLVIWKFVSDCDGICWQHPYNRIIKNCEEFHIVTTI